MNARAHLIHGLQRAPALFQQLEQIDPGQSFRILAHGNDGSVFFNQQRGYQRNLGVLLACLQQRGSIDHASQHGNHAVVLHHRLCNTIIVAVVALGFAHLGNHRLACFQPSKNVDLLVLPKNVDFQACFQFLYGRVNNPKQPLLVPRLQVRRVHLTLRFKIDGFGKRTHRRKNAARFVDGRFNLHFLSKRIVAHALGCHHDEFGIQKAGKRVENAEYDHSDYRYRQAERNKSTRKIRRIPSDESPHDTLIFPPHVHDTNISRLSRRGKVVAIIHPIGQDAPQTAHKAR